MNLREKRDQWEKNCTPILVLSQVIEGYPTVYVVVKNSRGKFQLHRYFPLGIGTPNCAWEVSVDKSGELIDVLTFLQDKLGPFNQKVEQADWEELDQNPLAGLAVKS